MKRKLARKELSVMAGNYESTDMIDFAGSLGLFDAVWIDMEHSPVTWAGLADYSRAADLWGMSSVVRVRANEPSLISLTLAEGVDGVIVPHVNSRAEAQAALDAAKFGPLGHRAAAGGRRSYGRNDYYERANDETILGVMIEDVAAVERIDEILSVEGIDFFFVASYDLSQSLGLLGQVGHPTVRQVFDRAVGAIVDSGRVAATAAAPHDIERHLAMGVRCIKTPQWRSWLAAGARAYTGALRSAAAAQGVS